VRFFGVNDKQVKMRMKSVKSIQKITKAMKMVAASKLKNDQRRLEAGMPFATAAKGMLSRLPVTEVKEPLTIVGFSSDRGLCGGVNSNVAKICRQTLTAAELSGVPVRFYGVGDKIRAAMNRLFGDRFVRIHGEVTKNPWNFTQAAVLTQRILADKPQRMVFVNNHFKSVIAYETLKQAVFTKEETSKMELRELDAFEFEPERRELWDDLIEFYTLATVHGAMLDNVASEQSARMSAMDNASKNAGEMLGALTLLYNKARQAKITMELIEIISGANAL